MKTENRRGCGVSMAVAVALALAAWPGAARGASLAVIGTYSPELWLCPVAPTCEPEQMAEQINFNGGPQSFVLNSLNPGTTVTVNQALTNLGKGNYDILISMTAAGDLFPAGQAGSSGPLLFAGVSLGALGNPLSFNQPVVLDSAVVTAFSPEFASLFGLPPGVGYPVDWTSSVENPSPWDGYFLGPNGLNIASESLPTGGPTAGLDVNEVEFNFTVTAIPEPTTRLTGLTGLAGILLLAIYKRARRGNA